MGRSDGGDVGNGVGSGVGMRVGAGVGCGVGSEVGSCKKKTEKKDETKTYGYVQSVRGGLREPGDNRLEFKSEIITYFVINIV